jgi:hypothetical protein
MQRRASSLTYLNKAPFFRIANMTWKSKTKNARTTLMKGCFLKQFLIKPIFSSLSKSFVLDKIDIQAMYGYDNISVGFFTSQNFHDQF